MKWVLVAIGLWSDGAHTFTATQVFDTEKQCAVPAAETYVMSKQPTLYRSYVCVPERVWVAFTLRGIKK